MLDLLNSSVPGSLCGIQLDLKYHLPNKSYLKEWVKRLPGYGINALLIEYEDAFPFQKYPFLSGPDAFSPAELREFLATVRSLGVTPIPLVQTYGHLEFALSHKELAHLRETPEIVSKICTRNPAGRELVRTLMSEILSYHEADPYIHLGADEVGNSGWCDACAQRISDVGPVRVWAEHELPFLEWVIARGKRPMVWDDVFWKDPQSIALSGLPRETILHTWGYNTTSLKPKKSDSGDMEFGGTGGALRRVDAYRAAGFDCIAGPCHNWGVLFPRHPHCFKNTQAWAQKVQLAGMMGMINTSWAVFHMPLQMTNMHVAATSAYLHDPGTDLDLAWQERWLQGEFGCLAGNVPSALEVLGESWEIPMAGYGRPFTPLVYGYMNMVLHYPGRQQERHSRGAYPADWNEIDFTAMYRLGVAVAKQAPDQGALLEVLDRKLATFPAAVAAVKTMAASATRHREEAVMMAVLAELKYLSLRVFAHLIRGDDSASVLLREVEALESPLRDALTRAWEPVGRARMWRAFHEPMVSVLKESLHDA